MAIIKRSGDKVIAPMAVTLPTEKSKPVTDLGGYSILFYGRKKIGKTTMCQHFPATFFLEFEPGAKKLSIFQKPVRSWNEFRQYVKLIIATDRFKTVVVDPVDIAYDMCMAYVCTKLNIIHPSEADWGKGWSAVKKEFMGEMNKLLNSGKGIIFISHEREETIEERGKKPYQRRTNTMSGQAKEAIEGVVDVWACYDYLANKRYLTILGDDFTDAGHRLNEEPGPRFLYTDRTPIRMIPMGKSSKEAYENFLKAFNNQLVREVSNVVNKQAVVTKVK